MMKTVKTAILPVRQQFAALEAPHELHREALCIFAATGFFMDGDTHWKDKVCLAPAHTHHIDAEGILRKSTPWFEWHYSPNTLTFDQTLEAYTALLTQIIKEQAGDTPVILPLSGGLDSRSQAAVLKTLNLPVHAFSYAFTRGYPEHHIAAQVARACGFSFEAFRIPEGYLWECIDDLARLNGCYSEFTHPRQMAVLPQLKEMTGVFSLGHWGDVFFDRGAPEGTGEADVVPLLLKKMLKPGGMELASRLWETWELPGDFRSYLISRVETSLSKIKIEKVSAQVRAFKTGQWAHRWTTTNLAVFEAAHPITLPYYDDRMCQFICTVPEAFLADRRLQLAHLKQHPELAHITWQAQRPFSIANAAWNKPPYNLPYRICSKALRTCMALTGKPYVQRNFELQFLGANNDKALQSHLFDPAGNDMLPQALVREFYQKFTEKNTVFYSHPVSMLLTLALWNKHFNRS